MSYVNGYSYDRVFYACDNLKYVKLPYAILTSTGRSVDYIPPGTFRNCISLENVRLTPVSDNTTYVHTIGYSAFTKTAMREFIIPEHVKLADDWFESTSYTEGTYNLHYYTDNMTFVRAVALMSATVSETSNAAKKEIVAKAKIGDFSAFKSAVTGSADSAVFANSLEFSFSEKSENEFAKEDIVYVSNGKDTFAISIITAKSLSELSVKDYPIKEIFAPEIGTYSIDVPFTKNSITVRTVDTTGNAVESEYSICDNKVVVETTNADGNPAVYEINVNRYFTKDDSQLEYLGDYILGKQANYPVDTNGDSTCNILDVLYLKKLIIVEKESSKLPFNIHTDLQNAYLNDTVDSISKYADGTKELSYPKPLPLKWDAVENAVYYTLYVSENEDLSDAWTFRTTTPSYDLYNCKIGTKYYYRADACLADGSTEPGTLQSFETSRVGPRNIYVDGVTNMRDLGGPKASGVTIKQGLIYRSGRYNENYASCPKITSKGLDTLLNQLHIRSEIDLRKTGENGKITDSVIPNANYYFCPMDGMMTAENIPSIRNVFEILADESNYPLVFHCSIGTDRTGFIAYLIGGLLGVGQEELEREFLFSNFGYIGGSRNLDYMKAYVPAIDKYEGNTLSEKIENYLVNTVGVTREQIESIKNILIQK